MAKAEQDLRSILDGGFNPREFPWYEPELVEVPEPAKKILESRIPREAVVEHVKKVVSVSPDPKLGIDTDKSCIFQRDRAFAVVSLCSSECHLVDLG
jgi:hypothetical protein